MSKTLCELQKARTEADRLKRRLKRINAHKMPLYWMVPWQAEQCMQLVAGLLRESENDLRQQFPQPQKRPAHSEEPTGR